MSSSPSKPDTLQAETPYATTKLRIVSLLPSITEVLAALGVADSIVGITHECDHPPQALRGATVVTVSDISPHAMTQEQIHEKVVGSLTQGNSLYGLNGEVLRSLQPDIVFTQSLCDVCAVSYPVVTSTCAKIFGGNSDNDDDDASGPKIVSLEPNNLKDVMETFLVAGKALQLPPSRAQQVVDKLQQDLDIIRQSVREHLADNQSAKRPKVAFLEWHEPFFSGGHWIADLMEIAGCDYRMCQSGDRSAAVSDQEFQNMDPDVILIGPCGFSVDRAFADTTRLMHGGKRQWWKNMRAVQAGNVFALDGNSYYARPGPRLVQGCGLIARCVHGEELGKLLGEDLAPTSGMRRVTLDMYEE